MNKTALERRVKKHILAARHTLFIPVIPGLEEPALEELRSLDLLPEREEEPGSLRTEGRLEDLWKIAYHSRCASRLYLRLLEFKAQGFRDFRKKAEAFAWELYLTEGTAYRLRFSLKHCRLHVTDNIGKTLSRSIRDRFLQQEGAPPVRIEDKAPQTEPGVQTLLVRGVDDRFTLSLDAGGGPLYNRGYRPYVTQAPLRETLAAALLIGSGISEKTFLIDPMCGSGTFHLEAVGLTAGIPSGLGRRFPFEWWPSFRPARYGWMTGQSRESLRRPCRIHSSDIDPESLKAAAGNRSLLEEASGLERGDPFRQADFFRASCPAIPGGTDPLLILNPPYGMRLSLQDRLAFFSKLGEKIRRDYRGVRWGIIVPGVDAEKALSLRWREKWLFRNGGIPVSFITGRV